jgi:(1->4)-alpha-D-glucan 1-alpha-D-glucosylmutase
VKTPRATYRLQLGPDLGLDDAAGLADYLAELGVSHVYCSPYLQAVPGSRHGYDVVDPTRVSVDLGGERAHRRLTRELRRHGLGQVLDIVPNHMAASPRNRLWWDVLRNGSSSAFAHFFDVDWDPPEARLGNRILLPVLEDHYGRVLEGGLLRLGVDGEIQLSYRDHAFPLSPRSLPLLLGPAAEIAASDALAALSRSFGALPEPPLSDPEGRLRLREELEGIDGALSGLLASDPPAAAAIDAVMRRTESNPDALDELLEVQRYRLAYWRAGVHDLDYRRFFDIDTLVALRVEHEEVFRLTHGRVLAWLEDGTLDGVRVDHVDGLRAPQGYLERLRAAAPESWIVVEKILGSEELLPASWPVHGTTGYDFLNEVGALFVDPEGGEPLTELYRQLSGDRRCWRDVAVSSRRRALRELLAPDVERLTQLFVRVCEGRRRFRDYTRQELREVLREGAAHLSVYRTYVDDAPPSSPDVEHVESALAGVSRDRPDQDPELRGLLGSILLARDPGGGSVERELRLRFQQLTGAVTAKAIEDTAFYAWPRLAALNEVGGDPGRFGLSPDEFHARNARRQARWPCGMLALSTHDTKRGEDVRARLFTLTEAPGRWAEAVGDWARMNKRHQGGDPHPDPTMEYLLYQTLVGAWPISLERTLAYMEKAAREAKAHTSWLAPDAEYEQAIARFATGVLEDADFLERLTCFVSWIEEAGWTNAAAQKLLQLTAPGVPDLYQGSELTELTLVDPDNRRPVDFELRRRLLRQLGARPPHPAELWRRRGEGLPKLWIVKQALRVRAEQPDAFGEGGGYASVTAHGPASGHVVSFQRGDGVITVVPRLTLRLAASGGWRDTALELPAGGWCDRLTGARWQEGSVPVSELLAAFPVALLVKE